jgi:hypothetical protein
MDFSLSIWSYIVPGRRTAMACAMRPVELKQIAVSFIGRAGPGI